MATREHYEKLFREADADNSGKLSFTELLTMLRRNGYKESEEDLKRMFQIVDISGEGEISFDEYMVMMGQQSPADHTKAALRATFVQLDRNGDGLVDKSDLKIVLDEMGTFMSDDDIARLIAVCDKDGDGMMNYEEFLDSV